MFESAMLKVPITPVVRGHIDLLEPHAGGQARLRGWIFRPDTPIDRIDITLQGKPWASVASLYERVDVKAAYEPLIGSYPHISSSGFDVTAPVPEGVEVDSNTVVGITPYTPHGLRLDSLRTYFCAFQDELNKVPQPPVHLQERVGGSKDFIHVAASIATLVMTCIGKYKPIFESGNILDWGCGCGTVISQLMKFVSPERLHGCDIDSAAIEWDKENLHGPSFTRVDPYPPTNYPECIFDVVYGISVMTHLDENTQMLWLGELKRIARPNAIVALSVMGEKLRATNMPASLVSEFDEKGFTAFVPYYSDWLSEFSHQEYYQEAYHTLDYITTNWGRYFEVLEYVETKFQDMVILRKV
jgi:2-polyprenyl-3-methyl-5-hydroxy-6-metoxy-1,4-benzoquinol methylase